VLPQSRADNSRHDLALEAVGGHEQRGEQGHRARHGCAALVIDQEPPVAAKNAEGLLDPPPLGLDRKVGLALAPDRLEVTVRNLTEPRCRARAAGLRSTSRMVASSTRPITSRSRPRGGDASFSTMISERSRKPVSGEASTGTRHTAPPVSSLVSGQTTTLL
jgi:hypothetical protein